MTQYIGRVQYDQYYHATFWILTEQQSDAHEKWAEYMELNNKSYSSHKMQQISEMQKPIIINS